MKIEKMKLKITLIESMLGTVPKNKELYTDFIATKAPVGTDVEDEVKTIEELQEKGWTGFHSDEKGLFIYDYLFKGFLKEAGNNLKDGMGLKAVRSKLDNYVFVSPRKIYLGKMKPDGVVERSLRVQTMQGPRTCLAKSDYIEAGTSFEIELSLILNRDIKVSHLSELLEYGKFKGLGQFRNGSYGRFDYEILADDSKAK